MGTALISALTSNPIRKEVAMTGEITLRGRVLPIGGLKEKSLAAFRAGCSTFVLPEANVKDLVDVPEEVKAKMQFVPARTMDEVLKVALLEPPTREPLPRLETPLPAAETSVGGWVAH
jgi:ATP-dependent Lon protease